MNPLGLTIFFVSLIIIILFMVIKQAYGEDDNKLISSAINPLLTPTVSLPTKTVSPTITPHTPTPTGKPSNTSEPELEYPNSEKKAVIGKNIILESFDNPFEITSWYQQKVKAADFKITSFIQTTTNGDVLNKIVGIDDKKEIRVEISKINNEPVTRITLSVNY